MLAGAKPKLCNPRHSERTLLYKTIDEHFETWFELASAGRFDGYPIAKPNEILVECDLMVFQNILFEVFCPGLQFS